MEAAELSRVLTAHDLWLLGQEGGSRADLTGAELVWSELAGTNLRWAILRRAVLTGADLAGANLIETDLPEADLREADLACADLRRADLTGADLAGANLAWADLTGANLTGTNLNGANLTGANLTGANLNGTILAGARGLPEAPIVPDLDIRMADVVGRPGAMEMGRWHTCEREHCRGGWAIHMAGKAGYALERQLGPSAAAALIYHASVGHVPGFHDTNENALADIRARAKAARERNGAR